MLDWIDVWLCTKTTDLYFPLLPQTLKQNQVCFSHFQLPLFFLFLDDLV